MTIKKILSFAGNMCSGSLHEPDECPLCKAKIAPVELNICCFKDSNDSWYVSCTYLCKSCYHNFICLHTARIANEKLNGCSKLVFYTDLSYCGPTKFKEKVFDNKLEILSPKFVKIYNQSFQAECDSLDEIAGLGYRKALEFLIKDFSIHQNPESKDKIKSLPLAKCINTYIHESSIKTLAEKSAWIGNDEAHYIRKQENRDIEDMKKFIQAAVYFIGMTLVVEDASTIIPQ